MTEIAELVAMNLADVEAADKCPFCYKAPHKFASRKGNSKKVVSKPSQLKCAEVLNGGAGKHTTAKHHLICAIQCFAQVKRLVRMATMVGYDINDPPNGLGLPTFKNKYRAMPSSPLRKYSELDDSEKQQVASRVMAATKAQWHVGHHAFEIDIPISWVEEWDAEEFGEGDEVAHTVSYDEAVIEELLFLATKWVEGKICEDPDDKSKELKTDLDDFSSEIKEKLEAFKDAPTSSAPYFVSQRAFQYALSNA